MRRTLLCTIRIIRGLGLLVLALWWLSGFAVDAHDSWISRGGLRNAAGEWCCGEGDCFVVPSEQVHALADGYHLDGYTQVVASHDGPVNEVVPFAETQPSPDGAFWRCKRPDGSRRCFFAPPPNT